MFHERPEQSRIGVGQLLIRIAHQATLGGGGVGGDIPAIAALATLSAVDIEFGNVNGQSERLQFCQHLIFFCKARRGDTDVGLRTDGHDRDPLRLKRFDQSDELVAFCRVLQRVIVVTKNRFGIRFMSVFESLGDEVRPDDLFPRRGAKDVGASVGKRLVHDMPSTLPSVNPNVLRTLTSRTRSRTDIAMVLAETSRMVNMTAPEIATRKTLTLPSRDTKPSKYCCSLSVLVCAVALRYS